MKWCRFRFSTRSRDEIRADVREELEFHLQTRIEALEREGLPTDEAHRRATREFGDVRAGIDRCSRIDARHQHRRTLQRLAGQVARDLRYSLRRVRRAPGTSATIVLTLAVGMAANAAVFSLLHALLLREPPVRDAGQLVRVQLGEARMSWPNFQDLRDSSRDVAELAGQAHVVSAVDTPGGRLRATGAQVTGNYLPMLGTPAALGRTLLPSDGPHVVVLSDRFWRTHFAADPSVVGRMIRIGSEQVEVVGVMPARFGGIAPPGLGRQFWMPLTGGAAAASGDRLTPALEAVARLRDGVTPAQAASALALVSTRLQSEHSDLRERPMNVRLVGVNGLDAFQGLGSVAVPVLGFLGLLAALAFTVLLVSCANIAGLLLGQATTRSREVAIRLALGSGRRRLIAQLMAETLVLAVLASGLAIALAVWLVSGIRVATSYLPFPVDLELTLDTATVLYTVGLACLASVVCGLAPARQAARTDLVATLKTDGSGGRRRTRTRLVTAQVCACSALLVLASLFGRSLTNVADVDPGFSTDDVYVVDVDTQADRRTAPAEHTRYRRLFDETMALPGTASAGYAWSVPLAFASNEEHAIVLADVAGMPQHRVMANTISPGYLETVSIRLLAGRDLSWADATPGSPVVLVNETAARRFWDGQALGRKVRVWDRAGTIDLDVIGVVSDSRYWTPGEQVQPTIYRSMLQREVGMHLFVRTTDPSLTLPRLRSLLERSDPGLPVEIRAFADATAASMMPARVASVTTAALGFITLLLAVLGVYGAVAFSVAQRTRELAVRQAIGASSSHLLRSVLGASVASVGTGIAAGVLIGCLVALTLAGFLVGVSAFDPLTAGAVGGLMVLTTLAASLAPAIRAAQVDPLQALREP